MDLVRYQREDGAEPFTDWLGSLRDKAAQARIRVRLLRIAAGAFGDCEPVGEGVSELRIHEGRGLSRLFRTPRQDPRDPALRRRQRQSVGGHPPRQGILG